ncbi:hypothetical protein Aerorivi_03706 [Aeromonas rivipollensis]
MTVNSQKHRRNHMTIAVFTTLASLASLLGLAFQLYKHKEKPLTYALLIVSFICAIVAAYSWNEAQNLQVENSALMNARIEADKLLESWPSMERFDFVSGGEFRGIVISGMAFLESNRELFPDTYAATRSLVFVELEAASNQDDNFVSKRSKLEEAAKAMVTTIKAIRVNKSMRPTANTSAD